MKNSRLAGISLWISLAVFWQCLTPLAAQEKEIQVSKIPASATEFINMRNEMANSPEGGAAMFVLAIMAFSKNYDLGMQFLTIALDKSNVGTGSAYKGYAPGSSIMYHVKRLDRQKVWSYTGFAYVKGATPENNYQTDAPYTVVTSRNRYSGDESSGRVKVFVNVAGFRPRPVTMQRNKKGIWKARECSSFFVNVPAPHSTQEVDDL